MSLAVDIDETWIKTTAD